MSRQEYSIRENAIIKKINQVNNALKGNNIKINYSVYNHNGIASKLEKSDLYSTDVSNAVFSRVHTCNSKYMVDEVVNSCNIQNNIEIEEFFNTKISDIESASVEDLVEYFGNLNNHEIIGFGKNKSYKILYKGIDNLKQSVEITASYGVKNKYKIRTSLTQIGTDGTIQKAYTDKTINYDETTVNEYEKVFSQGVEYKTPESYSLVEKSINTKGVNKFKINCLGNSDTNYSIVSNDEGFKTLDSVKYGEFKDNYFESNGKIEKASGKLACRINVENNTIIKPNFSSVTNLADASKVTHDFYKTYKTNPVIKLDNENSKIVIEGSQNDIGGLNLETITKNAGKMFNINKKIVIETRTLEDN